MRSVMVDIYVYILKAKYAIKVVQEKDNVFGVYLDKELNRKKELPIDGNHKIGYLIPNEADSWWK